MQPQQSSRDVPANGSLCLGYTCLQTRRSAKESGHSLEFNGPLQTREHSLLVIRRKERALDRLCSRQGFHSSCCTITCMHLHCTEKAYSCSLEFCLGGFIKINCNQFCAGFFLWPEWCIVCLLCVSCVLSLCHFTRNKQQQFFQPILLFLPLEQLVFYSWL